MQILEDHNKQLESQLHRLRQLLEQVGCAELSVSPVHAICPSPVSQGLGPSVTGEVHFQFLRSRVNVDLLKNPSSNISTKSSLAHTHTQTTESELAQFYMDFPILL